MSGLRILIPGTGPGEGPIIPDPLHSAGLAGYDHRYVASRIDSADGSPVSTWADEAGSLELVATPTPASARISHEIEGDLEYVRITNVNGQSSALRQSGLPVPVPPKTIAIPIRMTGGAGSSLFYEGSGFALQYTNAGNPNLIGRGIGATSGNYYRNSTDRNTWHLFVCSLDPSQPGFSFDGVEVPWPPTTPLVAGQSQAEGLVVSSLGATGLLYDFAEYITWPFATTAAQRKEISDALLAHYLPLWTT